MEVTIGPPPKPVERTVTITLTESEASDLKYGLGSVSEHQWMSMLLGSATSKARTYQVISDLYRVLRRADL